MLGAARLTNAIPRLGGSMERALGRYSNQANALMRIVVGFLFACHGAQKIFGVLGGVDGAGGTAGIPLIWIAGLIELVGGLMVATASRSPSITIRARWAFGRCA
jgi:hypothetical protein